MGDSIKNILDNYIDNIGTEKDINTENIDLQSTVNDENYINTDPVLDTDIVRQNVGLTGIGDSQYDDNIPLDLVDNLQHIRASKQGFWDEAGNALLGGVINGLATFGETASLILDIPENIGLMMNHFNGDEALNQIESNTFADFFGDIKESINEDYLPIYKKDPSKMIDFNDSAFYWEAFRGVLDSAIGFGLTGFGAGTAVKAAGAALKGQKLLAYSKLLQKGVVGLGESLETGVIGRLTTAYITNYGEGKLMGLELYERAYQQNYNDYIEQYALNNNGKEPNAEELKKFELDAKISAGKEANSFLLRNKLFIATDYLQLNKIFNGPIKGTRNILKKQTLKEILKSQISNAPKESLEEIGQNVIQMEGIFQSRKNLLDKGYNLGKNELDELNIGDRLIKFASSEQALLEGAMGLFGGPVQYAITQAPFIDFKGINRQVIDQNHQISENENYVQNVLYNDFQSETIKIVGESLGIDLDNETNNSLFSNLAIRNFARGTTQNLEDELNNLLTKEDTTEEQIELVKENLKQLEFLEEKYNSLEGKDSRLLIMNTEVNKSLNEDVLKKINKLQNDLTENVQNVINNFNELWEKNYTLDDYLKGDNDEDSDLKYLISTIDSQEFKKDSEFIKDQKRAVLRNLITLNNQIVEFSKSENADILGNVISNVSESKDYNKSIDYLKRLKNKLNNVTQKFTKEFINIQIKTLKKKLNDSQRNVDIDQKGGSEEIKKKVKKSKKEYNGQSEELEDLLNNPPEPPAPSIDDEPPVIEDDENITLDLMKDLENKNDVKEPSFNVTEPTSSDIDESVKQDQKRVVNDFNNKQSNSSEVIITNYENNDKITNNIISNAQDISEDQKQYGIKLIYNDTRLPEAFNKFRNKIGDKKGLSVTYSIEGDSNNIDNIPIKVTLDEDPSVYTYLFNVREGNSNKAAEVERNLRRQIIESIAQGNTPKGKILYQYSGEIRTDKEQKNLLDISEFDTIDKIEFLVVNQEGYLTQFRNNKLRKDPNSKNIIVANGNNIWTGALFTKVTAPNGKKIPLKLNSRKFTDNELYIVQSLLLNSISTKFNKPGELNYFETKVDYDIYNLLSDYDKEYLGYRPVVKDILNHLVYWGTTSKNNPDTQLYVNKGVLYFGDNSYSDNLKGDIGIERLNQLKEFVTKFKSRNINIKKLSEDTKYKDIYINNIITTDAEITEGNVFHSNGKPLPEKSRYKSMAIYVEPNIQNIKKESNEKIDIPDNASEPSLELLDELTKFAEKKMEEEGKKELKKTETKTKKDLTRKSNIKENDFNNLLNMIENEKEDLKKKAKNKKGDC